MTDVVWTGEELECEAIWILIQGFVSGDSTPASERVMRAHLDDCSECFEVYRNAVMTTAHIGGERRRERIESERRARHERLRRAAFEAQAQAPGRFHRLRTLVYPAFFAFLLYQMSSLTLAVDALTVTSLRGAVAVGEATVATGLESRLAVGETCRTARAAAATIKLGGTSLRLTGAAVLTLENVRPLRVRLVAGRLDVEGTCVVTTAAGVVDLEDAAAGIAAVGPQVTLHAISGGVSLTGPEGTLELPPGCERTFGD